MTKPSKIDELRKQAEKLQAANPPSNRSKLSDEDRQNIVTLAEEGFTHKVLGEMFKVHQRTIGAAITKFKEAANDSGKQKKAS